MTFTKICGVSTAATLDAAIEHGASHIGLNFYTSSPRHVDVAHAAALAARTPASVQLVGIFVDPNPEWLASVRRQLRLDVVQLHGKETPAFAASLGSVWKAISVRTRADLDAANAYRGAATRILYDAKTPTGAIPGGLGLRFDWTLLKGFEHPLPWGLSGGLTAANVRDAIASTGTPLVDVSSGVESSPGVKEVDKIAAFLQSTRHP